MDKKKIIWITLFLVTSILIGIVGIKDINAESNPICSYVLVGSNVSSGGDTQNTTFKSVIRTTSNQTSSQTFVRLENQYGYTLVTNQTGKMVNGTGETASYEATWAAALDASQTYSVSAAFFFLNNSFYNYSITQANCENRTFNVNPISGGFLVQQQEEQVIQEAQKKKDNMSTIIIVLVIVALIYFMNKKGK